MIGLKIEAHTTVPKGHISCWRFGEFVGVYPLQKGLDLSLLSKVQLHPDDYEAFTKWDGPDAENQ